MSDTPIQAPTGFNSDTKFIISDAAPTAALPGSAPIESPVATLPDLPGAKPAHFTEAPAFWSDASRIIADVLELYAKNPAEATEVWAFAKEKLAKLK